MLETAIMTIVEQTVWSEEITVEQFFMQDANWFQQEPSVRCDN